MSSQPHTLKAYTTTNPTQQIHYRYALPSGDTPRKPNALLFLHKSASSSASYVSLMTHYASLGYACYAPDMPGFGNSFDPSPVDVKDIEAKGTRWFIDVFVGFLVEVGLFTNGNEVASKNKIHIIGHHSGACLALEMAVLFPDSIKSICLVGPAVMSEEERAAMKEVYFKPFNEPVWEGGHLIKTWEYLRGMGIGSDLSLLQREAIDHIRAWRGRNLIYGAVWAQDSLGLYSQLQKHPEVKIMLMCARDDVLWKFFPFVKSLRSDVEVVEVEGGNFELDRDWQGIAGAWTGFIEV